MTGATMLLAGASANAASASAPVTGWARADHISRTVRPPRFSGGVFPVTDYGAVGDGTTLCTVAFRQAIEACNQAGGGRVLVPAGAFRTGAIHLLSNVELHLDAAATIKFSTDPNDYLPTVYTRFSDVECYNYSPLIYAFEQHNIAVTGSGTLDGQADWTNWYLWLDQEDPDWTTLQQMADDNVPVPQRQFGAGHFLRPSFVQPYRCTNVLIDGVTVTGAPMFTVHPVLSTNVIVQNVTVQTDGPNTDGCDPECCNMVVIRGCTITAGDDSIAVKAGRGSDGRRVNTPCQDVLIEDCTMKLKYGAVALGTDTTGGIRNVFVRNCDIGGPGMYYALYIKTNSVRGGFVENIYMNDIRISELNHEAITANLNHGEGNTGAYPPIVKNISVSNMVSQQSRNAVLLVGYDDDPIENVTLTDCTFSNVAGPNTLQYVHNLTSRNVSINGQPVDLTGNY